MSIGKKENILTNSIHLKIMRIMTHVFKVHRCEEIGTAQGTSRMSRFRSMHHANDIPANLGGKSLKTGYF